jgi:flagellar protein FlgJ
MGAGREVAALGGDPRALEGLKRDARSDPRQAARAAATQFEQLFAQMLLKSLREATPQFDPLAGDGTRLFQGMLDEQWAKTIAGRGLGLAPIIERQLTRNLRSPYAAGPQAPAAPAAGAPLEAPAQSFIRQMLAPAQEAARATGVPPAFILGQAGLESGWGRHQPRLADGSPSHNLFGIKAGPGWRGATVERTTTEYVQGRAQRVIERFRAYGSYAEAFTDYARLLSGNPRYAAALAARDDPGGFAQALQRAGYATDPAYADKLARTIRQARSVLA